MNKEDFTLQTRLWSPRPQEPGYLTRGFVETESCEDFTQQYSTTLIKHGIHPANKTLGGFCSTLFNIRGLINFGDANIFHMFHTANLSHVYPLLYTYTDHTEQWSKMAAEEFQLYNTSECNVLVIYGWSHSWNDICNPTLEELTFIALAEQLSADIIIIDFKNNPTDIEQWRQDHTNLSEFVLSNKSALCLATDMDCVTPSCDIQL